MARKYNPGQVVNVKMKIEFVMENEKGEHIYCVKPVESASYLSINVEEKNIQGLSE